MLTTGIRSQYQNKSRAYSALHIALCSRCGLANKCAESGDFWGYSCVSTAELKSIALYLAHADEDTLVDTQLSSLYLSATILEIA